MFEGFTHHRILTSETTIHLVQGGSGLPILLLHGYPQTHVCWHRVAPRLAERFTVICPDLRGYGDSGKPAGDPEHQLYSKRTMARDQVEVMRQLGFETFAIAAHDRGARVAQRLALDFPAKASRMALLDIVPTRTIYAALNQLRATMTWRYFFLIQPNGFPERLISAEPEFYLRWTLEDWSESPNAFAPEAMSEYLRCFDAATIHASCEDYRAGASIDLVHDDASHGQKLTCPLLLLWSATGLGRQYSVETTWREYATTSLWTGVQLRSFSGRGAARRNSRGTPQLFQLVESQPALGLKLPTRATNIWLSTQI
jgi:haloacetate dehalogenase